MEMATKTEALQPGDLYHSCDLSQLNFATTEDLQHTTQIVGQNRALEALDFGVGIKQDGYNLFVSGSTGLGKQTIVNNRLGIKSVDLPTPDDICYINNFEQQHKPKILRLPAGRGSQLRNDMQHLIEELLASIPLAFETEEYNSRVKQIEDEIESKKDAELVSLSEKATFKNVALIRTPGGYTLGPMKDGKILTPDEFQKLSESEQNEIKDKINEIEKDVSLHIQKLPVWARETRNRIKELNRETSQLTVTQFIDELVLSYVDLPDVIKFIETVKNEIINDADSFRRHEQHNIPILNIPEQKPNFSRFMVNVVVDNSKTRGAPVIYEDNPTYNNLMGRIEHIAQFGTLLTDFTLIKPGALHHANGGFLVFDVRRVLTSPFAWEGLKRALRAHEIRMESLEKMLSISSTISLEPEPIPIDVKVILTGDRWLYYLLKKYDNEFNQLFKVAVDFSEDIDRTAENTTQFSSMIARLQHEQKFKALDQKAVALVIESCSRKSEDAEKLTLHKGYLIDLLRESDYWSTTTNHDVITQDDVQKAIDSRTRRQDQLREKVHEQVLRGTYLLETEGKNIAQINALSIIQLGDYAFGRPSKVTATARLGVGKVIDIEREVDLGGSIHSKGVLILSSYLANRYAHDQPLSLSASLVFEQSYGAIEGDSASVAELCALLSAIANIPIDQSFAVTGSINQHGQVQAIGGVNEKIEGFFDICNARTLTGTQAVIIPESNIKHLMLRKDIVEAVKNNLFNVYAVKNIDQVMELLTGGISGIENDKGVFPKDSINGLIQAKLMEMNRRRQKFSKQLKRDNGNAD